MVGGSMLSFESRAVLEWEERERERERERRERDKVKRRGQRSEVRC